MSPTPIDDLCKTLTNKETQIRFLVSTAVVECIEQMPGVMGDHPWGPFLSENRICFSEPDQLFPGTTKRILMLSGTDTMSAIEVLVRNLYGKGHGIRKIRIIVPDSCCSVLRRDSTIKSIVQRGNIKVHVPPPDLFEDGLDRLVTVSILGAGGVTSQLMVIFCILAKLTNERNYPTNMESPYTYADMKKQTQIRVLLSNSAAETVSVVYGGLKSNKLEFQVGGARIQLSPSDEDCTAKSDRIITVSGTYYDIIKKLWEFSIFSYTHKIRLVVTNKSIDNLRRGGVTKESMLEKFGADFFVSPLVHNGIGTDMLITMSSSRSYYPLRQMKAIYFILPVLSEDACYLPDLESPYSDAGTSRCAPVVSVIHSGPCKARIGGPHRVEEKCQCNKDKVPRVTSDMFAGLPFSIPSTHADNIYDPFGENTGEIVLEKNGDFVIDIPEELVKVVRGHHGRILKKIRQVSRAKIEISDSGKDSSNKNPRCIIIGGSPKAKEDAVNMILDVIDRRPLNQTVKNKQQKSQVSNNWKLTESDRFRMVSRHDDHEARWGHDDHQARLD